jgi:hypothetical protein
MTAVPEQQASRVDTVPLAAVTKALRDALTGPDHAGAPTIVWSDRGAQVMLLLDSLTVRTVKDVVVIGVDTECVEFGRAPLVVRFSLATDAATATLVAATEGIAHGHPAIAARWGELFRDVVWAALVRLHVARAADAGMQPHSIVVGDGQLHLAHIAAPQLAQPGPAPA